MTSVDVELEALRSPMHSGMFGGPAPDPVVGLIQLLASLHDERGNTTIDGLDNTGPSRPRCRRPTATSRPPRARAAR
jgi:acetylornithine deacetylase/succinyl-diaminopimelate desuccinylase-like protein